MNIAHINLMLLACLIFLVVVGIGVMILNQRTANRRDQQAKTQVQQLEGRIQALENKIDFLNTGSIGLGQRLMSVEKRLNQMGDQQEELAEFNLAQPSGEQLYKQQADRILKGHSLTTNDSAAVSRSEARLMALVGNRNTDD